MLYHTLKCEKIEKVAAIHFMSPATGPVKTDHLADELADICAGIGSGGETRVVILDGMEEKGFSWEIAEPGTTLRSLSEPIAKLDLPVIASIDGDAIGQGLELALAADLRICAEASHFGFPHLQKGFIPWDGGTQRLSRLVGRSKALEMILVGERIDAQEAYRIGLVNRIVSPGDLQSVVMKMAQEMASKAPFSLRYAKEAVCKGMDLTLEQGLRLEGDLYFLLHTTRDREEGIKAFREKRTPRFEGK